MSDDEQLIQSITPDVMTVLRREHVFELLDDFLCPSSSSLIATRCDGTHKLIRQILLKRHFDNEAIEDAIAVLQSLGGYCDCEVLYNVATESRLKAAYWKGQPSKFERHTPHSEDRD
jgi:hypothetical protein